MASGSETGDIFIWSMNTFKVKFRLKGVYFFVYINNYVFLYLAKNPIMDVSQQVTKQK